MLGLLLVTISSFFDEIGTSIGKWESSRGKESVYTMGFLNSLWATLFLLALAFLIPQDFFAPGFPRGFVFNMDSLPTFLPRLGLELLLAYATVHAVKLADRSTFGFLHITTIPLLLLVDVSLGYAIGLPEALGMSLIVASLILLFINHGIRRRGAWLVICISLIAVATISLYKYDITHFNSIEAEQGLVSIALIIFFFLMARWRTRENPLRFLARPVFFLQSLVMGVAAVLLSFAYFFAAASVITTAKRAFTILFAVLFGNAYFHEKKLWVKLLSFALIVFGLILLAS